MQSLVDAGGLTQLERTKLSRTIGSKISFYLHADFAYSVQRTRLQKVASYRRALASLEQSHECLKSSEVLGELTVRELVRRQESHPDTAVEIQTDNAEAHVRSLYAALTALQEMLKELIDETERRPDRKDERIARLGAAKPAIGHLTALANGLWLKALGREPSLRRDSLHVAFAKQLFAILGVPGDTRAVVERLRRDLRLREMG